MLQLRACITKEVRLLLRDTHGLLLLFVMPLIFILIMSLALQNAFEARQGSKLHVLVGGVDENGDVRRLIRQLEISNIYVVQIDERQTEQTLTNSARDGEIKFAIFIGDQFERFLTDGVGEPASIIVSPNVDKRDEIIFTNTVRAALARLRLTDVLVDSGHQLNGAIVPNVPVIHAYGAVEPKQPTAVQQNVPAWLVFAIFFVSIPFSNAFIRERQLGTFNRLRTISISPLTQILGKFIPYFAINQLQVVGMLAAGVYLVPLLGGDALELHGSKIALIALCICLSVAALGFSLLVSVTARTTEQAIVLSGLGNIVLAAVGGVMVPKFVMPATMQSVTQISPMAWGLEGFLQLFLHNAGIGDIAFQLSGLVVFGMMTTILAVAIFRYSR